MAVSDVIKQAHEGIDRDAEGALTLRTRKKLWTALAAESGERRAYERRVALDIMCVRQVLAHWTARFDAHEIEDVLALASGVVAGSTDEADAERRRDGFYTDVVGDRDYGDDPRAMFVGYAAANTVIDALITITADAMPRADDDEDIDPENYHPSYMAASAAAGALNGRPFSAKDRRAFWRWYLDDAIPAIYPAAK